MQFMFPTVYWVTQKDFYARPYMHMRDLRHDSHNDDLELITPHMLINTSQGLEYRLDICRATTGAHIEVYGRAQKSFWVTLYTVENINCIKLLDTKT